MANIRCFLIEPTGREVRGLRRYVDSGKGNDCPNAGYHDAKAPLDVVDGPQVSGDHWPHDDPRWPAKCDRCTYIFQPDDHWQLFCEGEYRRADTGELLTIRSAPVGAMWWAPWLAGSWAGRLHEQQRGNGPHLIVKTPGGDWDIDSKASNSDDGWYREGDPPNVTARASIGIPTLKDGTYRYHGFLTNGELVEC